MTDTIAAIATPAGRGGVGIVRASGPDAADILRALVPEWPDDQPSHKLRLSRIRDEEGDLIDESLVVRMTPPRTYTGEEIVEFQCHGGPVILRRVLDAAIEAGARTAQPGEFTRRAFLNGRLDLTQAEAVADLIEATNEAAHEQALEHLEGQLGGVIEEQRERVAEALTLVQAAIDFSHEEHVYQIESDEIFERVDGALDELERLADQFDEGRRQREGVRVVLLGPTNAGKSSLFNALHGTDRAIVTDVAGTTRDFLEEPMQLRGVGVRLVDTAGLRATSPADSLEDDDESTPSVSDEAGQSNQADRVEEIGIERSRELKEKADVIVWVIDRSEGLERDQREELASLADVETPVVVALNKADQHDELPSADREVVDHFDRVIKTSALQEEMTGIDELADEIGELAEALTSGEGVLLSRARHLEHVRDAIDNLEQARRGIKAGMDHEFVAVDMREALDALGEIVGHVSTDDILGRIFSEFCVGK